MRLLIPLMLFAASCAVEAAPLDLSGASYTTLATAVLNGVRDGAHDGASPPDPLPLSSDASLDTDAGDHAAADALADAGLLTASSEAGAVVVAGSARAEATLHAEFDAPGVYALDLAFDTQSQVGGGGSAGATLSLALEVDGRVVFDESFTAADSIARSFTLAAGQRAILDLGLLSLADAAPGGVAQAFALSANGGEAFNLASVAVALELTPQPVPAPAALGLMGLGMLTLVARRRP